MVFSANEDISQSPLHPQTFRTKFRSMAVPSFVWETSGWNWTA